MGLEVIGLGLTAASTAMGMAGAAMQGQAGAAAANYRAQVARNNALIARYNAEAAQISAQHAAQRTGLKGAEQLGQITAIQGASGIDLGSGSFAAVRDSAAVINRLDQMTDTWKGDVRATEFRNQRNSALAEASIADAEAQNARTAGQFQVLNTLIGGANQFATRWNRFYTLGVM